MRRYVARICAIGVAGLLALLITPIFALAAPTHRPLGTTSPQQCDPSGPAKYACAYITYSIYPDYYGTVYSVDNRYFEGATDDSAQKWQLQYFKDYRWNGSAWLQTRNYGPTTWLTNYNLTPWYVSSGSNPQHGGAYSEAYFQYYEVSPSFPSGYYWNWGPWDFYVT